MADRLVLIDVNNTLVKDQRDVSEYIFEAIRSKYGFEAQFKLEDYEGTPAQLMLSDILEKNGVSKDEADARLESCAEELGYSYYNVTGRDPITLLNGSKQLLDELAKRGVLVGIATGDIEDVIKNKLQRAVLSDYFKFGEYGNKETDLKRILQKAVERAGQFGLGANAQVFVIASSPHMMAAAKANGMHAIGVASGRYSDHELSDAGAEAVVQSVKDRSKIMKTILR